MIQCCHIFTSPISSLVSTCDTILPHVHLAYIFTCVNIRYNVATCSPRLYLHLCQHTIQRCHMFTSPISSLVSTYDTTLSHVHLTYIFTCVNIRYNVATCSPHLYLHLCQHTIQRCHMFTSPISSLVSTYDTSLRTALCRSRVMSGSAEGCRQRSSCESSVERSFKVKLKHCYHKHY